MSLFIYYIAVVCRCASWLSEVVNESVSFIWVLNAKVYHGSWEWRLDLHKHCCRPTDRRGSHFYLFAFSILHMRRDGRVFLFHFLYFWLLTWSVLAASRSRFECFATNLQWLSAVWSDHSLSFFLFNLCASSWPLPRGVVWCLNVYLPPVKISLKDDFG